MAYLSHLLYHEALLSKIEKALHPFSEDHPFFSLSEIPYISQDNISKIVSIKNKTKVESARSRDLISFSSLKVLSSTLYKFARLLYKNKNILFQLNFRSSDDFTWNSL